MSLKTKNRHRITKVFIPICKIGVQLPGCIREARCDACWKMLLRDGFFEVVIVDPLEIIIELNIWRVTQFHASASKIMRERKTEKKKTHALEVCLIFCEIRQLRLIDLELMK